MITVYPHQNGRSEIINKRKFIKELPFFGSSFLSILAFDQTTSFYYKTIYMLQKIKQRILVNFLSLLSLFIVIKF